LGIHQGRVADEDHGAILRSPSFLLAHNHPSGKSLERPPQGPGQLRLIYFRRRRGSGAFGFGAGCRGHRGSPRAARSAQPRSRAGNASARESSGWRWAERQAASGSCFLVDEVQCRTYALSMAVNTNTTVRKMLSMPREPLQAIEDYRFENRIRTESQAIHRLIELGLKAAEKQPA
jgi:hypothetical protein